jgi:hypothetical protein
VPGFLQVVYSSPLEMAGRMLRCEHVAFCEHEGALEPPKSHHYCMHRMTMGTPRKAAPQVRIQMEERLHYQEERGTGLRLPRGHPSSKPAVLVMPVKHTCAWAHDACIRCSAGGRPTRTAPGNARERMHDIF